MSGLGSFKFYVIRPIVFGGRMIGMGLHKSKAGNKPFIIPYAELAPPTFMLIGRLTSEEIFTPCDFDRGFFLRQILSFLTSAQSFGFSTSLQVSGVYMGQYGCFFDMD